MDLSNPLAVVTPTLDAAVLQTLAATTGWATGAQVHRTGRVGSVGGVRKVLARLVQQGIVLAIEHPHATLYTLNRDHVAAEAIVSLTLLRGVVVERISRAVSAAPVPVRHASLFGSFARGEATTESDIDILVVVDEQGRAPQADQLPDDVCATFLDSLAMDIQRWTGNQAQIAHVTPSMLSEMASAGDPLVESWRADHVHLTGTRLLELLRRLP